MTSATREYLGDTIHLLRLEHNMTMEELAQKVGVTKATISRWESGEIQCARSDKVKKLASVFGMTADELLQNQRKEQHPMPDKKQLYMCVEVTPDADKISAIMQELQSIGERLDELANELRYHCANYKASPAPSDK